MEGSSDEGNMDYGGLAQEVCEGNNIGNHSCHILAKNATSFFSCSRNTLEARLKSFTISSIAKKITRQPNIDFFAWLVVTTQY